MEKHWGNKEMRYNDLLLIAGNFCGRWLIYPIKVYILMNIFYEESGQFKVAAIVQKNEATYQVDTQHGKRAKVKANHVFLEFGDDMAVFLEKAQHESSQIDIDLLWEVSGEEEISAEDIAKEYFGNKPSQIELASTLIALYAAPMYFYKKNKGMFKAAPEETLKQALAAIERKKQQDAQVEAWTAELLENRLPESVAQDLPKILHAPDKQSLTYKAFAKAADTSKKSFLALAQLVGGIESIPAYLLQGFTLQNFPKGLQAEEIPVANVPFDYPKASVKAFSIDDESTTEVDDAISLVDLPNGGKRIGIHIAAPSLAISADSDIEKLIFERLSTVYYPGHKVTMLPENWIQAYSLDEGDYRPAISLYADVDPEGNVTIADSKIEWVMIDYNLRIQDIEPLFNRQQGTALADGEAETFAHQRDLIWLLNFGINEQKKRDRFDDTRPTQYDYSIELDDNEHVSIGLRERGSPVDTVVSELMILANSNWAKWLDETETSAIFRVQPAGKVRFSTQSEGHIGMGVSHYAWCTSPLRRATDYINQRQLLSLIDPDNYAERFENNNSDLFALLRQFESAYSAYADFQRQMELYWSLVYLQQENITELKALVLKEELVRLEGLPMVAKAVGIPVCLPRSRVWLKASHINLLDQSVSLNFIKFIHSEADEESAH